MPRLCDRRLSHLYGPTPRPLLGHGRGAPPTVRDALAEHAADRFLGEDAESICLAVEGTHEAIMG